MSIAFHPNLFPHHLFLVCDDVSTSVIKVGQIADKLDNAEELSHFEW